MQMCGCANEVIPIRTFVIRAFSHLHIRIFARPHIIYTLFFNNSSSNPDRLTDAQAISSSAAP